MAHPRPRQSIGECGLKGSLAGVAALGVGGAAFWYSQRSVAPTAGKILAQTDGALDPLEQGFEIRDQLQSTPMRNKERTGFDRLDLRSPEQGSFYRKLSLQDIRAADSNGWKITLKGRPIIGGLWACADFRALNGPRFDLSFYREPDGRALALLCTQHIPTFEGPRYEMPDQGASSHLLELVYDTSTKTCQLYVDGRRQAAGYKGHRQQQAKDPLDAFFFGISVYRSERAEAEVEAVRFEVL